MKATHRVEIAIIGGTGLDETPEFVSGRVDEVSTRFGREQVVDCSFGKHRVLFVPRHGVGHSTPPHTINYRAQIAGLKKLGVERVIGVCSVGSLVRDLAPGSFAVLGDFVDLTRHRAGTFFDAAGEVVHTDFSHPYCPQVSDVLSRQCRESGVVCRHNAVYVGVEGPRYESPAEVRLFASWGGHVVGMTNMPEAILAREAGLCYGALAVVTNYATGISTEALSHDDVRKAVADVKAKLREVILGAIDGVSELTACSCSKPMTPFWDQV